MYRDENEFEIEMEFEGEKSKKGQGETTGQNNEKLKALINNLEN